MQVVIIELTYVAPVTRVASNVLPNLGAQRGAARRSKQQNSLCVTVACITGNTHCICS